MSVRNVLLTVIALLLCLAGCTSAQPASAVSIAPMWKDEIDRILAQNTHLSDFERQVLSDYVITDAEYAEVQDLFKQCMSDQGWSATFDSDGRGLTITALDGSGNTGAVPANVELGCQTGTLINIQPLYFGMRDNPQGLSNDQLIRACFDKKSVPDGTGLTDDEFSALVGDPDCVPSSGAAAQCMLDPTGSQGVTEEAAAHFYGIPE